jgi:hypothetical protein
MEWIPLREGHRHHLDRLPVAASRPYFGCYKLGSTFPLCISLVFARLFPNHRRSRMARHWTPASSRAGTGARDRQKFSGGFHKSVE